jgi:hypothetical protein
MFTPTAACRFALFFLISLSANAEKGGLRVLDQSESTVDTSKALAVVGADDAHRMLNIFTNHDCVAGGVVEQDCVGSITIGTVSHYEINYSNFGGKFLVPGIYKASAAMGLTGILTLVGGFHGSIADTCSDGITPIPNSGQTSGLCPSSSGDEWEFIIDGAVTTAELSTMVILGNDGSAAKVDWDVKGGAITLGAGAKALGSMKTPGTLTIGTGADPFNFGTPATTGDAGTVRTFKFDIRGALTVPAGCTMSKDNAAVVEWKVSGAITLGAGAEAVGDMESEDGAITLGADAKSGNLEAYGAIALGAGTAVVAGNLKAGGAIIVGAGAHAGTLRGNAAITKGASIHYHGYHFGLSHRHHHLPGRVLLTMQCRRLVVRWITARLMLYCNRSKPNPSL